MDAVTKIPLIRPKSGPSIAGVLHRDSIARFMEKIAPKVSLLADRAVRKIKSITTIVIGGKKFTKFVYAEVRP